MIDLKKVISEKTDEVLSEGKVEETIKEQIQQSIEKSIREHMSSYSDFGKVISDSIKKSISVEVDDLRIPQYNKFIAEVVADKFTAFMGEEMAKNLSESIDREMPDLKQQSSFSKLMDQIRDRLINCAHEEGKNEIEVIVKDNTDGDVMYVEVKHPEYSFYDVKFTLHNFKKINGVDAWEISYISRDGREFTGKHTNSTSTYFDDVSKLLYRHYLLRTKFDADCEISNIDVEVY